MERERAREAQTTDGRTDAARIMRVCAPGVHGKAARQNPDATTILVYAYTQKHCLGIIRAIEIDIPIIGVTGGRLSVCLSASPHFHICLLNLPLRQGRRLVSAGTAWE